MTATEFRRMRGELLARGHTFASLAEELGVGRQHVRDVAAGRAESARVKERIAAALGRNPWPRKARHPKPAA